MYVTNRTVDAEEEAIEQEEDNKNEEVEEAKDESESTESVQVLSAKTTVTSEIHNASSRINIGIFDTLFTFCLVAITCIFLYSEADAIQSALEDMWDKAVTSYSKLYYEFYGITDSWYYSMMPEIETIQPDTPFYSAVDEPYVPTDKL